MLTEQVNERSKKVNETPKKRVSSFTYTPFCSFTTWIEVVTRSFTTRLPFRLLLFTIFTPIGSVLVNEARKRGL